MDVAHIPKIELHCHLDGIISPAMTRALRAQDPAFPIDPDIFEQAYPIYDLATFWNWWAHTRALRGLDVHIPILKLYVDELKAQQVRYFEVMIASGELPADAAAVPDAMRAFRAQVDAMEQGQIQVEFLLIYNRQKPPEGLAALEDTVLGLHEAGLIAGFGLAGPEPGYPVKPFAHSLARFHEAGIKLEIHAGEWVGPESVWDALKHGFPDRIGHGVTLFADPRLLEVIQERNLHIEFCPTSNLLTASVDRIENHPIQSARARGMNFSVSTDDPGVFGCSMNSEFALLVEHFGFTEDNFARMYASALNARFQPALRVMV